MKRLGIFLTFCVLGAGMLVGCSGGSSADEGAALPKATQPMRKGQETRPESSAEVL